ncbi:DNA excision repair protein ERCC-1 [Gryllus bimaculatus]|nr:DNA excision repair protein ERCC-1 [Gryllus bimaculatus]
MWQQYDPGIVCTDCYQRADLPRPKSHVTSVGGSSTHCILISALTTIRSINRTDAATLLSSFGSLKKILSTSQDVLSLCPGVGPKKASQLYKVLHQPFLKETKRL